MEYKNTRDGSGLFPEPWGVLILVLMEYKNTLYAYFFQKDKFVLILVLMEYKNTLQNEKTALPISCLNPCSNGIQKYRIERANKRIEESLNPCSNGIQKYTILAVCVLAVSCLNPCSNGIQKYWEWLIAGSLGFVLILVLMEYKNTVCKSIS